MTQCFEFSIKPGASNGSHQRVASSAFTNDLPRPAGNERREVPLLRVFAVWQHWRHAALAGRREAPHKHVCSVIGW
jgi:hypothetical protein